MVLAVVATAVTVDGTIEVVVGQLNTDVFACK